MYAHCAKCFFRRIHQTEYFRKVDVCLFGQRNLNSQVRPTQFGVKFQGPFVSVFLRNNTTKFGRQYANCNCPLHLLNKG